MSTADELKDEALVLEAVAAFKLFSALHVEVGPRLLVYPSIALAVTSLAWLGFHGH
jgi:hypothetical protein